MSVRPDVAVEETGLPARVGGERTHRLQLLLGRFVMSHPTVSDTSAGTESVADDDALPVDEDDRLGVEIGFYGGSNEIPCDIWSSEETVSSETVVRLLGQLQTELRRSYGAIPGMMPPNE